MDRPDKNEIVEKLESTDKLAYRVKDAREIVGVPRGTFYGLLAKGEIESFKLNQKTILVPRQALITWIEKKRQAAAA
jgi:excisionase family DNA binding protein